MACVGLENALTARVLLVVACLNVARLHWVEVILDGGASEVPLHERLV